MTTKKGMTNTFGSPKLTSKQCLVYLEGKPQQGTCGWRIFKLSLQKTREIIHLKKKQKINKVPLMFLDVEMFKESL